MPKTLRSLSLSLALLAGVGLVLSSCGRKGDLDVPGGQHYQKVDGKKKPVVEDRPFFLDPIL